MRTLRNFIIGLTLTIIGIIALMLIPSTQAPAPKPWEVRLMADGQVKVMGIHLGTTTYKDVQLSFKQYGETAVFSHERGTPSIEAYFNSVNLGGLSAKVVLNLELPTEQIEHILSHSGIGRIQPSGARRHDIAEQDKPALLDAKVIGLTYIPSVRLDEAMLANRFGEPTAIMPVNDEAGSVLWLYPDIGLTINLSKDEKSLLQYQLK